MFIYFVGRCKSAFHKWLGDIYDEVIQNLKTKDVDASTSLLTNCTWERFGERLAENGARQLGLFDELTSFFSTMNMYSSQKMTISDTKEYQDFLSMFTGNSKTRETITGNANFRMSNTTFTMLGFTQPASAIPILKDTQNSSKGFTSRIIWMFPKPVFAKMQEIELDDEEFRSITSFKTLLVDFLVILYKFGELTYEEQKDDKVKVVEIKRREFHIDDGAKKDFQEWHDEWEGICERFPYDHLIGGLYSRAKAQLLRLSVPIQLLLHMMEHFEMQHDIDTPSSSEEQTTIENEEEEQTTIENEEVDEEQTQSSQLTPQLYDEETEANPELEPLCFRNNVISQNIGRQALKIAKSITDSSIQQQCILNERNLSQTRNDVQTDAASPILHGEDALIKRIILVESSIISFTVLIQKGFFRNAINGNSGRTLVNKILAMLSNAGLGSIERYNTSNSKEVVFFQKQVPPQQEDLDSSLAFSANLAKYGISLPTYIAAYKDNGTTFDLHDQELQKRVQAPSTPTSSKTPKKRARIE